MRINDLATPRAYAPADVPGRERSSVNKKILHAAENNGGLPRSRNCLSVVGVLKRADAPMLLLHLQVHRAVCRLADHRKRRYVSWMIFDDF